MIRPSFLQKNDKVGIVSPAGFIDEKYIDAATELYKSWGLSVVCGKHVLQKHSIYAGTDIERQADVQEMLDDEDIKAIFFSRGGYGSMRILPNLDFSVLQKSPKWLVGFSDITLFHACMNNIHIASLHAPMPKNYLNAEKESLTALYAHLFGQPGNVSAESSVFDKVGEVEAELIGGNLSVIYSMRGTPFDYDYKGKILLIEDLTERLYHLDRMLKNLKNGGVFDQISGLVVGGMTDMYDGATPYGKTAYEIIAENVDSYKFPVAYNMPIGHIPQNKVIEIGGTYKLIVSEKSSCLSI